MKLRRRLSAWLFGLGCAVLFIGLLSLLLPLIANDHLMLVLKSFFAPARKPLVRLINAAMSYALTNAWQVTIAGMLMALAGGVLFCHFDVRPKRRPPAKRAQAPARRAAPPAYARPSVKPAPRYDRR